MVAMAMATAVAPAVAAAAATALMMDLVASRANLHSFINSLKQVPIRRKTPTYTCHKLEVMKEL